MASNNLILKLHKSRVNLLKQCESLGYNVSEHMDVSNLEVDKLYVNNKLDMIIENDKKNKKQRRTLRRHNHKKTTNQK